MPTDDWQLDGDSEVPYGWTGTTTFFKVGFDERGEQIDSESDSRLPELVESSDAPVAKASAQ